MKRIITARELRATLPSVVAQVRRGAQFTVNYRSRPAFQILPVEASSTPKDLAADTLYHAPPVGRATDGRSAAEHDQFLYGK